ncbi:MAG: glycosyltransferase family 4 protein [Sphingomonas bacterium]|nr:glycosyltransferase family 4 protein [Sphingomonas bacterium]
MKIMLSSNAAWNLANFRKPIIEALVAAGFDVIAVAPADGQEARLEAMGARFRPIRMRGAGTSPVEDSRLLLDYIRLLREERPAMFLGFTAKPNIYGSLAARMTGIPMVATISGLGSAFLRGGLLGGLLLRLYRLALGGAKAIMFQNPADRELFIDRGIARPDQARLVAGSGIDLDRFVPAPIDQHEHFRFLLIARLLLDKGIAEFVAAARIVRARYPHARFQLLGGTAADNPSAVPQADLERWAAESIVEQLGVSDDVRPYIAAADCIVLPSYREGLPRSLLEGAAMARPLIASAVPGCRDVVDDGVNGLLCEVRSVTSLAVAMERMLAMTVAERLAMGTAGRHKVEAEFDQILVANAYLAEIAR